MARVLVLCALAGFAAADLTDRLTGKALQREARPATGEFQDRLDSFVNSDLYDNVLELLAGKNISDASFKTIFQTALSENDDGCGAETGKRLKCAKGLLDLVGNDSPQDANSYGQSLDAASTDIEVRQFLCRADLCDHDQDADFPHFCVPDRPKTENNGKSAGHDNANGPKWGRILPPIIVDDTEFARLGALKDGLVAHFDGCKNRMGHLSQLMRRSVAIKLFVDDFDRVSGFLDDRRGKINSFLVGIKDHYAETDLPSVFLNNVFGKLNATVNVEQQIRGKSGHFATDVVEVLDVDDSAFFTFRSEVLDSDANSQWADYLPALSKEDGETLVKDLASIDADHNLLAKIAFVSMIVFGQQNSDTEVESALTDTSEGTAAVFFRRFGRFDVMSIIRRLLIVHRAQKALDAEVDLQFTEATLDAFVDAHHDLLVKILAARAVIPYYRIHIALAKAWWRDVHGRVQSEARDAIRCLRKGLAIRPAVEFLSTAVANAHTRFGQVKTALENAQTALDDAAGKCATLLEAGGKGRGGKDASIGDRLLELVGKDDVGNAECQAKLTAARGKLDTVRNGLGNAIGKNAQSVFCKLRRNKIGVIKVSACLAADSDETCLSKAANRVEGAMEALQDAYEACAEAGNGTCADTEVKLKHESYGSFRSYLAKSGLFIYDRVAAAVGSGKDCAIADMETADAATARRKRFACALGSQDIGAEQEVSVGFMLPVNVDESDSTNGTAGRRRRHAAQETEVVNTLVSTMAAVTDSTTFLIDVPVTSSNSADYAACIYEGICSEADLPLVTAATAAVSSSTTTSAGGSNPTTTGGESSSTTAKALQSGAESLLAPLVVVFAAAVAALV